MGFGPVYQTDWFQCLEFQYLEDFESDGAFQEYIDEYVQCCIDSTLITAKTIPCFVSYEVWDRELNKYYQQLQDQFTQDERALLLESQRLWISDRDRTVELNSSLLDWKYEGVSGAMFDAMRAGDADEAIAPMVRQRALLLRHWADLKKAGQYRNDWLWPLRTCDGLAYRLRWILNSQADLLCRISGLMWIGGRIDRVF
ncbi:MAG: lysozyme inhibitor LprI family protein [Pseudomonadota bacterium]|nr:lysozyme inhibitor LprI family protein [Pseudomonadota bacterium]